ncbi:MAG: LapA family protein [Candidatus Marinimicrobia bacterium]|nr:LapA family protein [Candidatus Neomarinimicrobiota bacterium]
MKFAKLIILFIVFLLLLIFVAQNSEQNITLKFFTNANTFTTKAIVVLLITLMIGLLIGFFISSIQILSSKNKLRVVSTEYKKLKNEVDLLRNIDVEEPAEED